MADNDVIKALVDEVLEGNVHPDRRAILEEWRDDNTTDEERESRLTDDERREKADREAREEAEQRKSKAPATPTKKGP